MKKDKIVVILGPTSSGKSDLAVFIAKKFNGEIISADSRQVYKGFDIGSGKITKKEMQNIPHHLIDVVNPKTVFSVAQFKKKADQKMKDIIKRGKLPIIVGGTGFYIQSIVDNIVLPEVKPNQKLRKELEKKTLEELIKILKKLDSQRLEELDQKNPRRLMRAIEIATQLGKVPKLSSFGSSAPKWEILQIGIRVEKEILNKKIEDRFKQRLKQGIVEEAEKLHKNGLSWNRMNELGLAHKYIPEFLRGRITKEEMIENSIKEEQKYAKRQRTWFKRDTRINWFGVTDSKASFSQMKKEVVLMVKDFLVV